MSETTANNESNVEELSEEKIREQLKVQAELRLQEFKTQTGYDQMTDLDQAKFWASTLPTKFVRIWEAKDVPLEVVCEKSLFEAVSAGLQMSELPEELLNDDVDPEMAKAQFRTFCQNIPVKLTDIESLILGPGDPTPVSEQFVVIVSRGMRKTGFLMRFDEMMGLSQTMVNSGIPLTLNESDLEMLFKIHLLMQCEDQRKRAYQQAEEQQRLLQHQQSADLFVPG